MDQRHTYKAPTLRRLSQLTLKAGFLRDPDAARSTCVRLQATPGILSAHVHTFHGHALVHFDAARISEAQVRTVVRGTSPRGPLATALVIPFLKWLPTLGKVALAGL